MTVFIDFLTEQNNWTLFIFIVSLVVDTVSAYYVDKVVHEVEFYLVLLVIIVLNILVNAAYLSQGVLYNISPILSIITIILLCCVLVKIDKKRQKELIELRLKNAIIIEQIYQSFAGTKKKLCKSHYDRIVNQDLEGACPDCPIVEQLNLNK